MGELVEKETRTITDNDQRQVNVARILKINSCMPCPMPCYFYDGVGRVDMDKVKNFLGCLFPKLIAFYRYKDASSSCFRMTSREKLIHQQLAQFANIPSEFFTCCLLVSEKSDNGSTHSFTQNFLRFRNRLYEQLPLHIVNLSDSNYSYKSPEPMSESFTKLLKGLAINHQSSQGLATITKIETALQTHTNSIVTNLAEAENRLSQLEQEVQKLKDNIKNRDPYREKDLISFDDSFEEQNEYSMDTGSLNNSNSFNDDVFVQKRGRKTKIEKATSPTIKATNQETTRNHTTRGKRKNINI